jgi:hypothetical protein
LFVRAIDYAYVLKELADIQFPNAKKITLVQDNLTIHKPSSLYEAFPASKPVASSSASSGFIRQSMAVGSIWLNPNLAFSLNNASTAEFPTKNP